MTYRICPFCSQPMQVATEFPKVSLTPAVFRVLHILAKAHEAPVPYHELAPKLSTVKVYACKIRMELRRTNSNWAIENVYGKGYRLYKKEPTDAQAPVAERPQASRS